MTLQQTPTDTVRTGRARLRMISPAYPAFNIYTHAAKYMTSLGPVVVATAVNDIPGWDVEVIDENNYHRGPKDEDGKPDPAGSLLTT